VKEVIALGDQGGAGNLIICEVLLIHIKDEVLDDSGMPDPFKTDLVSRMGGDWYCRANGEAIFELPKPNKNIGIGYDQIPEAIRNSLVLTGNNLGRLGNIEKIPDFDAVKEYSDSAVIVEIFERFKNDGESLEYHLHTLAQDLLKENKLEEAWLTLLQQI